MPEKPVIESVSSLPAKTFFVDMLTRDIELRDAILDLLDNCVDGAIRSRSSSLAKQDSLHGYWAKIHFTKERFTIEDNCGGIPWDIANEYAFRMGRPQSSVDRKKTEHLPTIGVVGIGMKRAIFKMGRKCVVHSNHKDDAFLVSIEPEWFQDDEDWEFTAEREKTKSQDCGTILEIEALTDPTKVAFAEGSSFRQSFPQTVAEMYSYILAKGFSVSINGVSLKRKPFKLCFEEEQRKRSPVIRPYIYKATINGVEVFLAVGYRSRMKAPAEMEDEAESTFAAADAGWTILCNDRVVVSNDQTAVTGWGTAGVPNFHNQFSCIAGIVEFRSSDPKTLPTTTTKRGIDSGTDLFLKVRERMQEGLKCFTRNSNRWRGFETDLKARFDAAPFCDLKELKLKAQALSFRGIPGAKNQSQYKPELPEKSQNENRRRISFIREVSEIEQVSNYLFDEIRDAAEVGEACFDKILKETNK